MVKPLSVASLLCIGGSAAFQTPHASLARTSALHMVLEKPRTKEISKLETLKIESDYLIHPLKEV